MPPSSYELLFGETSEPKDEQAALYDAFLSYNKDAAFRQAKQKEKRYEQLFRLADIPVPEEDKTKGFIGELFDTLDTGGQFVRGMGAKLLDVPGYEEESLFGAGRKGTQEDLTVGEIMRKKDFLAGDGWGSRIARGGLGFLGDVFTDPLTYVTFGSGSMGRHVIDRSIAEKALIKTAQGDMKPVGEVLNAAQKGWRDAELTKRLGGRKFPNEKIATSIEDEVRSGVEEKMLSALAGARSVVKDSKALERSGIDKFAESELLSGLMKVKERDAIVKAKLGLADDVDLADLFVKPGIRFTSPLAPILGPREMDIPLVTGASEYLLDFLGGKFYNLADFTNKTTKAWAASDSITNIVPRTALAAAGRVKDVGRLLSRRVQVGGKGAQHILNQADRQHAGAALAARDRADAVFDGFVDAAGKHHNWDDADLTSMTHALEQLRAGQFDADGNLARLPGQIMANEAAYEKAKQQLIADMEETLPGKGAKAAEVMDFVRNTFDEYFDDAARGGFEHGYLDGYVHLTMRGPDGLEMSEGLRDDMYKRIGLQDFMRHRSSMNIDDAIAKSQGFYPETNLRKIFEARTTSHIRAKASKNFQERLGFEVALDPETYVRLNAAVMSHNAELQNSAARLLESKGFRFDDSFWVRPKDAARAVRDYLPIRHKNGVAVTLDEYDNLVAKYQQAKADRLAKIGGARQRELEALEEGKRLKIDLKDEKAYASIRQKIEADQKTFSRFLDPNGERGMFKFIRHDINGDILRPEDWDEMVRVANTTTWSPTGRTEMFTPAAIDMQDRLKKMGLWDYARYTPNELRRQLDAQQQIFEATKDKMVWLGRAGEDEFARSGLERVSDKFRQATKGQLSKDDEMFFNGLLPRPMIEAINESLETKDVLKRMMEKAGKGDPMSGPLANIGKLYLGWVKLHKMASTLIWPSYLVRNVGSAQFQQLQSATLLGESLNLRRLWETSDVARKEGQFIQEGTGEILRWSQLRREMAALDLDVSPKHFMELAEGQADVLSYAATGKPPSRLKKGWEKWTGFTAKLENYGRHNLYIHLRRQGMAPSEAAEVMNKAMVDYSRGKTKFEKAWMNNTIFFYSFARGQASNTFNQMIHKPGALTAQLHAINGVKEVLLNGNTDLAPDLVGEMESLRSKESVSRYLGTNDAGVHQLLTEIGMPAEELSRFVNIHLPQKWTLGGISDAIGMTAKRTLQTGFGATNPLIKGIIEYIWTNRSLYFDRPLTDRMMRRFPQWEKTLTGLVPYAHNSIPAHVLKGVDEELAKVLDLRPNGDGTMTASPAAIAMLTYLVPGASRALSTANALAKAGPTWEQKALRLLTGVKVTDIDPDNAQIFERTRRMEDELMQQLGTTSKRQIVQQMALIRAGQREEE